MNIYQPGPIPQSNPAIQTEATVIPPQAFDGKNQ
jgi:hypothetical protein